MDTEKIINEWFYRLPKGYANYPYSDKELEVLHKVLEENELTTNIMLTLIYGVKSAGQQTITGFHKLADHAEQFYPEHIAGAEALRKDAYMDDLIWSEDTTKKCVSTATFTGSRQESFVWLKRWRQYSFLSETCRHSDGKSCQGGREAARTDLLYR